MIYHYTPIKIAKIRFSTYARRMWNNRNSYSLLVGMKNGTATLKKFVSFL